MMYRFENLNFETYYEAFVSGAIDNAVKSLCLPAINPQTGKPYVTQWGIPCTSMSFLLGAERLGSCFPKGAKWTDMWQGMQAALAAVTKDKPKKRLGCFTPYTRDLSKKNHELLKELGYTIETAISLDQEKCSVISTIDPKFIFKGVVEMCKDAEVDCVMIGCSSLRACMPGFISSLEKEIGVPVVTSTQAFLWHMLREAGIPDQIEGYGVLLKL